MKLILENWREYLKEEEEVASETAVDKLLRLFWSDGNHAVELAIAAGIEAEEVDMMKDAVSQVREIINFPLPSNEKERGQMVVEQGAVDAFDKKMRLLYNKLADLTGQKDWRKHPLVHEQPLPNTAALYEALRDYSQWVWWVFRSPSFKPPQRISTPRRKEATEHLKGWAAI